jgi:hypothetical protein
VLATEVAKLKVRGQIPDLGRQGIAAIMPGLGLGAVFEGHPAKLLVLSDNIAPGNSGGKISAKAEHCSSPVIDTPLSWYKIQTLLSSSSLSRVKLAKEGHDHRRSQIGGKTMKRLYNSTFGELLVPVAILAGWISIASFINGAMMFFTRLA